MSWTPQYTRAGFAGDSVFEGRVEGLDGVVGGGERWFSVVQVYHREHNIMNLPKNGVTFFLASGPFCLAWGHFLSRFEVTPETTKTSLKDCEKFRLNKYSMMVCIRVSITQRTQQHINLRHKG